MPAEKAMNFGPSAQRLLGRLRPERLQVVAGRSLLAVVSVALSRRSARRSSASATDLIFAGVIGQQLPAGHHHSSRRSTARAAAGNDNIADLLAGDRTSCPGQGIDFAALGHVLLLVARRSTSPRRCFSWLQGYLLNDVVQRTVLPAARATSRTSSTGCRCATSTGSRAASCSAGSPTTSTTSRRRLQQTMSQLLTSLLTVVGVLAMMFSISPLLA